MANNDIPQLGRVPGRNALQDLTAGAAQFVGGIKEERERRRQQALADALAQLNRQNVESQINTRAGELRLGESGQQLQRDINRTRTDLESATLGQQGYEFERRLPIWQKQADAAMAAALRSRDASLAARKHQQALNASIRESKLADDEVRAFEKPTDSSYLAYQRDPAKAPAQWRARYHQALQRQRRAHDRSDELLSSSAEDEFPGEATASGDRALEPTKPPTPGGAPAPAPASGTPDPAAEQRAMYDRAAAVLQSRGHNPEAILGPRP